MWGEADEVLSGRAEAGDGLSSAEAEEDVVALEGERADVLGRPDVGAVVEDVPQVLVAAACREIGAGGRA